MQFRTLEFKVKDLKYPLILNAEVDKQNNVFEGSNYICEQAGKYCNEDKKMLVAKVNSLAEDIMVYFEKSKELYKRALDLGIQSEEIEVILPKFTTTN